MTSLGPKIENFKGEKQKPTYLSVIEDVAPSLDTDFDEDEPGEGAETAPTAKDPEEPVVFYICTGVGSQQVVFKRNYSELAQIHSDERTQKQLVDQARA